MSKLIFEPSLYAAIDCGTGSMRMQAFDIAADGSYEMVLNESREHEIGRDLTNHQALSAETIELVVESTKEFLEMGQKLGARHIAAAATESLRSAKNGAEVLQRLAEDTLPFTVLSGLDELQTSLMGVLPYLRDIEQNFYFADSGGGSTEVGVIQANDFAILEGESLQVGVSSWGHRLEVFGDITEAHHMEDAINDMTKTFGNAMARWPVLGADAVLVVAGAPMHLFRYARRIQSPSHLIVDRTLTRKEVEAAAAEMAAMGMSGRLQHPHIDGKGASFMLPCSLKILALMNVTGSQTVRIVPSGICAGLCLQAAQIKTNKVA